MTAHPPIRSPFRPVAECPRIVGLVTEHRRPEPAPTVTDLERSTEPPASEPELSLDGELNLPGVGTVRGGGGARGTPAIVALHRVLIILGVVVALVAGAVAIVAMVVRAPREEPRRPDLGRCTEHIERTPHAEYIERTCTRNGS